MVKDDTLEDVINKRVVSIELPIDMIRYFDLIVWLNCVREKKGF